MSMITDEELDRDWKPNGRRPQSTVARSFSQELMDIFRIEESVADLDKKVDERKQVVQTRATELEALEARIKEMEERLKKNGTAPAPRTTIPVGQENTTQQTGAAAAPATAQDQKHGSRPGTAKASQQAVPGALPPTPVASEGEYEFVEDPYTTSFGEDNPRFRHQHLVPRRIHYNVNLNPNQTQTPRHNYQQQQQYHHPPPPPQPDARSIKSVRTTGSVESASADFVIVPGTPDGDGEQGN